MIFVLFFQTALLLHAVVPVPAGASKMVAGKCTYGRYRWVGLRVA